MAKPKIKTEYRKKANLLGSEIILSKKSFLNGSPGNPESGPLPGDLEREEWMELEIWNYDGDAGKMIRDSKVELDYAQAYAIGKLIHESINDENIS